MVIAGLISAFVGIYMIIRPVPNVFIGGIGRSGGTRVMSVITGNDAAIIGLLILFMGGFLLVVAYKIKNP